MKPDSKLAFNTNKGFEAAANGIPHLNTDALQVSYHVLYHLYLAALEPLGAISSLI
jgi:hypothetical protein